MSTEIESTEPENGQKRPTGESPIQKHSSPEVGETEKNTPSSSPPSNSTGPSLGDAGGPAGGVTIPTHGHETPVASGKEEAGETDQPARESPGASACQLSPTRDGARSVTEPGDGKEEDATTSSDDLFDDDGAPMQWISTKAYEYLVHPAQPGHDFLGSVLKTLIVKRTSAESLTLKPERGQFVFIDDRKYLLVLCIRVSNTFRVIIRDEESTTNFCAMAKAVTEVTGFSGKSKAKLQAVIAQVTLFCSLALLF